LPRCAFANASKPRRARLDACRRHLVGERLAEMLARLDRQRAKDDEADLWD
jgi:hypothetical protein